MKIVYPSVYIQEKSNIDESVVAGANARHY